MFELQKMTDEKLEDVIALSLGIAHSEGGPHYNSWYKQMNTDLAMVYQNEQKRRQTERCIRVVEELTDVIRRKKFTAPSHRDRT